MAGRPVTVRTLDPPLHEFLPHEEKDIKETADAIGVSVKVVKDKITIEVNDRDFDALSKIKNFNKNGDKKLFISKFMILYIKLITNKIIFALVLDQNFREIRQN